MSSVVVQFEAGLQAILALAAPGISAKLINALGDICKDNVQSESVLVGKMFSFYKRAPPTHKLAILYVIDAAMRKWLDKATANGEIIDHSSEDGSYGSAVNRVKELMPVFINDLRTFAPVSHMERAGKLVNIWERNRIFPTATLALFREKLTKSEDYNEALKVQSFTPEGSPSLEVRSLYSGEHKTELAPSTAGQVDATSILKALAKMAQDNATAAATAAATASISAPSPIAVSQPLASIMPQEQNFGVTNASHMTSYSLPPYATVPTPTAQMPTALNGAVPYSFGSQYDASVLRPIETAPPVLPPNMLTPEMQQQLQICKTLYDTGVPHEQWAGIIAILSQNAAHIPSGLGPVAPAQSQYSAADQHSAPVWDQNSVRQSRDRYEQNDTSRVMHQSSGHHRDRSRSPVRGGWSRDSSVEHLRDGLSHNAAGGGPGYGQDKNNGTRRDGYRQRSPMRKSSTPPTTNFYDGRPDGPKLYQIDASVPDGHIKVLSRTLFIGNITCSEQELKQKFSQWGRVQTSIVDKARQHGFIKMFSRKDSKAAKEGMEGLKHTGSYLKTKWGVGFGPRECCDYSSGVSIVPMERLTDADRKWLLTAPYGGTGGKPIVSKMAVEEPDIEIGQGVSSKSKSRRMFPDYAKNQPSKTGGRHRPSPVSVNALPVAGFPSMPSPSFGAPALNNGNSSGPPNFGLPLYGAFPMQPPRPPSRGGW